MVHRAFSIEQISLPRPRLGGVAPFLHVALDTRSRFRGNRPQSGGEACQEGTIAIDAQDVAGMDSGLLAQLFGAL